ncbi:MULTISPECIES: acyltransferase family protein [unclassified Methylobacterium]|uniref:acyltransferase family protein n=1 Tax=unclassified Methylobacterium TaxID=2615210 RepID=UPI00135448CC|nr:acyltransferase [Methylobacterium sp. 2A]
MWLPALCEDEAVRRGLQPARWLRDGNSGLRRWRDCAGPHRRNHGGGPKSTASGNPTMTTISAPGDAPASSQAPAPSDGSASGRAPTERAHFETLDILRVVACLAVILYHYTFRGAARDGMTTFSLEDIHFVTKYGYLGVELFFVISGFVISYSAETRSAGAFLVARATRIYPGFLFCMSFSFLVLWALGPQGQALDGAQWLANLAIAAPAFHAQFVDGVYWSIVCELIFYAWIFLLKTTCAYERYTLAIVAAWMVVSVLNICIWKNAILSYLFLTKYSAYFAAGITIYEIFYKSRSAGFPVFLGLILPLVLIQGADEIRYHRAYYAGTDFDVRVGAVLNVAVIAIVVAALRRPPMRARRGVTVLLGAATYPMYLIHQRIGYVMLERLAPSCGRLPALGLTILVLFVGSALIWRFIETPVQRLLRTMLTGRFRPRQPPAVTAPPSP